MDHVMQHPHVLTKFRNHEIRSVHWLHEPHAQEVLQRDTHVSAMIRARKGVARCCSCGCFGDFVMSYRHHNERRGANHVDVFALLEHDVRMFTQDHILPRSLGGTDRLTNMRLMCNKCNSSRGNSITIAELDQIFENLPNHLSSSFLRRCKFEQFLKKSFPAYHMRYLAWVSTQPGDHEAYGLFFQTKLPKPGAKPAAVPQTTIDVVAMCPQLVDILP